VTCPKCGSRDKHFCPPSLGELGFYLCECTTQNTHQAPVSLVTTEQSEILDLRAKLQEAEAEVLALRCKPTITDYSELDIRWQELVAAHDQLRAKLQAAEAENARLREALEASTDLLDRVEKAFAQAWCIDWNDIPIQAERNRKALEEPK
jgi:chromosome segregation ATPase